MIIAHMNDGKTILLGIERENIERLKQGKPMRISAESHPGFPLPDVTLFIIYGETVDDLVKELLPGITDKSVILDHRKKP